MLKQSLILLFQTYNERGRVADNIIQEIEGSSEARFSKYLVAQAEVIVGYRAQHKH